MNDQERAQHAQDVEAASQISLFNFCGITAKDGRVLLQLINHQGALDPEDALGLAAWLIVGAEMAGQERAPELAACLVQRIRNT
jgi:uncharacterized membrane protein YeiH